MAELFWLAGYRTQSSCWREQVARAVQRMPTYEMDDRFDRDLRRLRPEQRVQLGDAVRRFVATLQEWEAAGLVGRPSFPAALRVKPFHGAEDWWELSWAGDGRCLWSYGPPEREGKCHVIWLRVGSHEIYRDP